MEDFSKRVPTYESFVPESNNHTESMRNYKAWLSGKEPLKHCFFTHREGDKIYDFVKKSNRTAFKLPGFEHFEKK